MIGVNNMKKFREKFGLGFAIFAFIFFLSACSPANEVSDDITDKPADEQTETTDEEDKNTDNDKEESEETSQNEEENASDQAKEIPLTVYQADDQLMALEKIDAQVLLNEDESEALAFQRLLSGNQEGNEDIYLLPEGTKINSLSLNDENIVEIDLSNEYISNMNAGSSGEQFYLQGLVNTLAKYYEVQEVLLTVDGKAYQTGHYNLNEGQTLSFDESLVNE